MDQVCIGAPKTFQPIKTKRMKSNNVPPKGRNALPVAGQLDQSPNTSHKSIKIQ